MHVAPSDLLPVLLVHGAWHGAWCWAALQSELDRRGIPSYAIDLPGHGLSRLPLGDLRSDAAAVSETLEHLAAHGVDEVVLMGHSYGGAVITEAAAGATNVRHLVYLTAFALAEGESVMGLLGSLPPEHVKLAAAMQVGDDGIATIDPMLAVPAFYGDCPPAPASAAVARLGPQPMATFLQPVTTSPRVTLPSTYVVCTRDEAIAPAHQRVMAERCTHVVTLDADHSPFIGMPGAVADVLEPLVLR